MIKLIKNFQLNNLHFKRNFSTLKIGSSANLSKVFTKQDVEQFAKITLDNNDLHFNTEFAIKCGFKEPIVHGILVNGLVSALLGTVLPGKGSILINEEIKFLKPVFINEEVVVTVKITNMIKKKNRIYYQCNFQGIVQQDKISKKICLEGNANLVKKLIRDI